MEPKKILMLNQKGGCGKTLLIDQLCYIADKVGMSYSLRDYDQQGGLVHKPVENPEAQIIFIDTPGQIAEDIIRLIPGADIVLVPTLMSRQDMKPLENTISILAPYIENGKDVLFILNKWNRYATCADFEEWFYTKYGHVPSVEISEAEPLRQAEARGIGIMDYRSKSKSALELGALWNIVISEHLGLEYTV